MYITRSAVVQYKIAVNFKLENRLKKMRPIRMRNIYNNTTPRGAGINSLET